MKISEVLHLAADKYLAKDYTDCQTKFYKDLYSCNAVKTACIKNNVNYHKVKKGLVAMGLKPTNADAFVRFNKEPVSVKQAARYSWLKFAAMIAEEQGV